MVARSPFIGRESELSELRAWLREAREGRGGVVLVSGDLGIGKTRFIEECLKATQPEEAILAVGRWYESPEVPAYIGFRESLLPLLEDQAVRRALDPSSPYGAELARLGQEFAAALGFEGFSTSSASHDEPYRLWRGVSLLLEAAASVAVTLLVLDDLQWADAASLGILGFLGREITTMPVLIIGAYREEDTAQGHPLQSTISELTHARALRALRLTGLSREEVASLAVGISSADIASELVTALHDETQGNPLFVEEMMHSLLDKRVRGDPERSTSIAMLASEFETPEGLRTVMGQRLSRLSDKCQLVLSAGAAIGREFGLTLLESAGELTRDELLAALDEATRASVLREVSPGLFAFAHPLMRHVIHQRMAPSERLRRHAQIAECLERLYGPRADAHAREIAAQLVAAGGLADPDKVVTYALAGARQARRLFAFDEARRLLLAALRVIDQCRESDLNVRANLLMELGYAEDVLGNPDQAVRHYRDALAIHESQRDEPNTTAVRRWLSSCLLHYGRWPEALTVTRAGLAAASEQRTHAYHGLVGNHVVALMVNGPLTEAGPWVMKGLELAFDCETGAVAHHAAALWHSWGGGDRSLATPHYATARKLFLENGSDSTAAAVACDQALAAYFVNELGDSAEAEAETERLATVTGRRSTLADLHAFASMRHVQKGEWEQAERRRGAWREYSSMAGGATLYGQFAGRGEALELLWKREPDAARTVLDPSFALNQPLIAALRAEAGDREGATQLLGFVRTVLPAHGRGLFWLAAALPVASALTTLGDETAGDWRDALSEYSGCLFDWFMVDIELGRICAVMSRWDDAEGHYARAAETCGQLGLRPFLGQVKCNRGLMLLNRRAPGDRRLALALLEEAEELFRSLGLDYLQQKVRSVLARPRRGRPPSATNAGLTERELAVLSLLTEGKSNREIAAQLYVVDKTVEHHLDSIYSKLGVTGRVAAVAYALREGIL